MAKKTKYSALGKDLDSNGKLTDKELVINLPDPPEDAGMPLSKKAFDKMVGEYAPTHGTTAVTFTKEAILTVLAQYGCAAIKFHFGLRENNAGIKKLTLIMEGVDSAYKALPQVADPAGDESVLLMDWGQCTPPCE